MDFKRVIERLLDIQVWRRETQVSCTFGNKFLDEALTGIYRDDFVIITAKTGGGKTELSSQIAEINAINGKRVHMFALEAYEGEIEARIEFRMLAKEFYKQGLHLEHSDRPRFQDWVYGKQEALFAKVQDTVTVNFMNNLKSLHVYYRNEKFNISTFESLLGSLSGETDLVILDHLHHFDLETEDETREVKRIVKKMRDLTMFYRIPTVVVTHIRKTDPRFKNPIPTVDDIFGSSEISKVATKIIVTSPAPRDAIELITERGKHCYPTYFQILKNRLDGSVTRAPALCAFDILENRYVEKYRLGYFDKDQEFKYVSESDLPSWAVSNAALQVQQTLLDQPMKPVGDLPNEADRITKARHTQGPKKSYHDKDAW